MPALFDSLWIDVRHSVRGLLRSSGISLVVVVTVALVIGANTTVFGVLNAVVLRTIAVADPERLVAISAIDTASTQPGYIYADTFTAFRAQQRSFSILSMYSGGAYFRVEARGVAVDAGVEGVMPEYFGMVGARAAVGRSLIDTDGALTDGGAPVVVITDRLWRRLFGGDATAVGKVLKIDGTPVTVVGVTTPGFYGLQADAGSDLFVPLSTLRLLASDQERLVRARYVVGRLRNGVALAQARAEVLARWPAIQAQTMPPSLSPAERDSLRTQRITVESAGVGFSGLRTLYRTALIMLVGITAILLTIGCVNLTALLLARGISRRHQITVRRALGAGRARLFRQVLIDGELLAMCGLAAALPMAWSSGEALTAMLSVGRTVPLLRPLTPDGHVVGLATIAALLTGLMIGVLPAWHAVTGDMDPALRQGRVIAGTIGRSGKLLLVTQVALSMVLVVGAGLFIGTLLHLRANEAQLTTRRVVWTRLSRDPGDHALLGRPYYEDLVRRLASIPGVDNVSLSYRFPAYLGFAAALPTDRFSRTVSTDAPLVVSGLTEFVSPSFFDTFGIARLRGRDFRWNDDDRTSPVAIVSETVAHELFADTDAVGQRLRVSSGPVSVDVEIVGVVGDAPIGGIRDPHPAVVFRPMMQDLKRAQSPMTHVLVRGDANTVRDAYIRVVEGQGHHFVRGLFTLKQWIDFALLDERLIAGLSLCAAALALILVCIGIYGHLAYAVTSRVREIGVRMALGATRRAVVRMVVRDGISVVVPGVVVGIPCALAVARLVRSQLYGLAPSDPMTIVGAAFVFVVTGFVATLLPALRASRIDPIEALHQE